MSQNDFNIANQGFPATRADINSALQALASNSAGTAEPSTTYAYQFWYDETNELLKMRNSDNDAWITIGTFDQVADTFTPAGVTTDKIEEGNSSVEVVDTGTGYVAITVDGVEAARVDANGRLGIGTTSPNAPAAIVSKTTTYEGLELVTPTGDGSGEFHIGVHQSGSTAGRSIVFKRGGADGMDTESMRIDSSGNLLVGTTDHTPAEPGSSGNYGISLRPGSSSQISVSGTEALWLNRDSSDGDIVRFRRALVGVGSIAVTSSATSYNTGSDYRLKENIIPLTGAADRLAQIPVRRFNFIADPNTTVDGFIAHEVQDFVPEAVTGIKDGMTTETYMVEPALGEIYTPAQPATYDEEGVELTPATDEVIHSTNVEQPAELLDGQQWRETTPAVMGEREVPDYQGIDQSKLVPLLTAALQEALQKIDALEARVTALGG